MTKPGARLLWLDLARGLAVISMVIAHTAPWGGVFVGTEYLTAPWFVMLVGISLLLAWEKAGGGTGVKSGARSGEQTPSRAGAFIAANVARGLLLILAGELLQRAYWQIDVVLQTLGLLTIVLAPLVVLVGRRRWVWAAISAAMVAVTPLLMDAARDWLLSSGSAGDWTGRLVSWGAAGIHYRVTTFLAIAAAGIAAAPSLLAGRAAGRRGLATAGVLLVGSAAAIAGGRLSPLGADAYSGTWPEIIGVILLSLAATWFCAWLVDALGEARTRRWVGAVVDTGRMAFTAYAVQVLALAAIVAVWLPGQRDDHWAVMLGVIALCVGLSWAWLRVFPIGPLEWVLRLPGRVLTGTG